MLNYATDPQIKLIRKLIETKAWNSQILVDNLPRYVERVAALHAVFGIVHGEMGPIADPQMRQAIRGDEGQSIGEMTDKALTVLRSQQVEESTCWGSFGRKGAGSLITWLLSLPDKVKVTPASERGLQDMPPAVPSRPDLEDGVYRDNEGRYVKVYHTQKGHQVGKTAQPSRRRPTQPYAHALNTDVLPTQRMQGTRRRELR